MIYTLIYLPRPNQRCHQCWRTFPLSNINIWQQQEDPLHTAVFQTHSPPSSCWIFHSQSRDRVSRAVHTICLLSSVWGARWTKWNTRSAVSVPNSAEATGWNTRDVLFFSQHLMCNSVTLLWTPWRAAGGQFVLKTQMLSVHLSFRLRLLFSSAANNTRKRLVQSIGKKTTTWKRFFYLTLFYCLFCDDFLSSL